LPVSTVDKILYYTTSTGRSPRTIYTFFRDFLLSGLSAHLNQRFKKKFGKAKFFKNFYSSRQAYGL
jgi:hypothetical protein